MDSLVGLPQRQY